MKWSRSDIERILIEVLAKHIRQPITLSSTTNLVADAGLDSVGFMELLGELEHKFDLMVPDDALRGLTTVAEVTDLISKELEKTQRFSG